MAEIVLEVQGIRRAFGATVAVDDVNFTVERGEIKGLLGPNGAGKTTAIRIIMGILEPDRGTIRWGIPGQNGRVPKDRIGYLPEERGLYHDAKVLDNLLYLAQLKGCDPKETKPRALEWLERLDLVPWAGQKLEKLSKGMQQKVQFIAALLHQPDLVMLDEPFSGLDPINQNFFKDLILELRGRGVTVLLSAHQMNVVEELCDSLTMIHRGRLVLDGTVDEIKDNFQERIVEIGYRQQRPALDPLLAAVPGLSLISEGRSRLRFRFEGDQSPSELVQTVGRHIDMVECSVHRPPLHDIFVNTVKDQGGQIDDVEMA